MILVEAPPLVAAFVHIVQSKHTKTKIQQAKTIFRQVHLTQPWFTKTEK